MAFNGRLKVSNDLFLFALVVMQGSKICRGSRLQTTLYCATSGYFVGEKGVGMRGAASAEIVM